jgi:hypothetical protein
VFVWSAWKAAKKREGRERIFNRRCCIPSLATTDSRLLLVEVSRPYPDRQWHRWFRSLFLAQRGAISIPPLPAFPSLPFSISWVGKYLPNTSTYLPTHGSAELQQIQRFRSHL